MGISVETTLIMFSLFLFRLPAVLEGSSMQDPSPTVKYPTQVEPSAIATKVDAVKLNGEVNYFQEIPSIASKRVLKTHNKISRIQCVLRCKQNMECVDVTFNYDNVCLLLGRPLIGTDHHVYSKIMSMVRFPGIFKFHHVCLSSQSLDNICNAISPISNFDVQVFWIDKYFVLHV